MLHLVVEAGPPAVDPPADRLVGSWRDAACSPFAHAYAADGRYRFVWCAAAEFRFAPPDPLVRAQPFEGVAPDAVHQLFQRAVEPIVLTAYGHQALHGSAVASPSGAIVFTGDGGQGKSTFAYGLAETRGWPQLADDAVVFEMRADQAAIHPLTFLQRLRPESERYFGVNDRRAPAVAPGGQVPIHAVVFLDRQEPGTGIHVRRLPPAQAFEALLSQAHRLDPTDRILRARFAADYLAFAERVPTFVASYAPAFDDFPAQLDAIVARVTR